MPDSYQVLWFGGAATNVYAVYACGCSVSVTCQVVIQPES